jgi:hypothetical protein
MTSPTWRDLAAGADPSVPQPPTVGVPAPTPSWRDLIVAAPEQPPAQPPAPVAPPAGPAPVTPGQAPPAGDPGLWAQPAAEQVSPLTPQPSAPSSAPPEDPAEAQAAVGMRIAAAGATATDVDAVALLRMIQGLQAQVAALTAQQVQAQAPEVVKYATAFADHLQAKADAHPVINSDPDHTFIPALRKAAGLVNAAEQVAASGAGHEGLVTLAKDAGAWIAAHARHFPAIDYDYLGQLAEEVAAAAVKLAAL